MYDRRILVLLIERVQEGKELFCHTVPTALRDYAKALDKDKNYVPALNGLGSVNLYQNKIQKSIDWFDKALNNDSNNIPARISLGISYSIQNKYEKAERNIRLY